MGEITVLGGASSAPATAAAVLKDLDHVLSRNTAELKKSTHDYEYLPRIAMPRWCRRQ
jgi:hypothetical protein